MTYTDTQGREHEDPEMAAMREHVCRLGDPWPTGHPLPPENPERLQGPDLGYAVYHDKYAEQRGEPADVAVRVIHRSYVWSPGECRHRGGYRHYDWSVIERGPGKYRAVVVNDTDLRPLAQGEYAVIDPTQRAYVLARAMDYGRSV